MNDRRDPPAEPERNDVEQAEQAPADEQPPAGERQQSGSPRDRQIKASRRNR